MSRIDSPAKTILGRIARIDLRTPQLDRAEVEYAMHRHLRELDGGVRTIQWIDNGVEAYRYILKIDSHELINPARQMEFRLATRAMTEATRKMEISRHAREPTPFSARHVERLLNREISAASEYSARHAARDAAWQAASRLIRERAEDARWISSEARLWEIAREGRTRTLDPIDGVAQCIAVTVTEEVTRFHSAAYRKLARTWRPIVEAAEAGLFLYWITLREVVCVPIPSLFIAQRRLHREDGPAIQWRSGQHHWFWHGTEVPEWLIEDSDRITAETICAESGLRLRRCMIERFGAERLIDEIGGELIATDDCGKLWRCRFSDDDTYAVVEVDNGTDEPGGSRRRYCLSVPPFVRTPREAVAWTYGLQPEEYDVALRT